MSTSANLAVKIVRTTATSRVKPASVAHEDATFILQKKSGCSSSVFPKLMFGRNTLYNCLFFIRHTTANG